MAKTPTAELSFTGQCPDCGERTVKLPDALPEVGDDFDWRVRDYDSFTQFMLEELMARFPERRRWTPGDLEVVLVEVLAAVLDQLSDMTDRVAAESYLETARRPESVRRLLSMIGYDAVATATARGDIEGDPDPQVAADRLTRYWLDNPHAMDLARYAGPRAVHTQHRMVTTDDYGIRLEEHPLVLRAQAWTEWGGSWELVRVAIIGWNNRELDTPIDDYPSDLRPQIEQFHAERGLSLPPLDQSPTIRTILRPYVDAYRMAGQQVFLQGAVAVGIYLDISIQVTGDYYQSEVRRAVAQALGTDPGGFFEPGRLRFGEELYAADIFQALMDLDGVQSVCLNRFKRVGGQYPDQSAAGEIVLSDLEIAVCDNRPDRPERGYFRLVLHGGWRG
ncbi:MAG: hypothetical protein SVU69_11730 [Pseudomonadota bacterium]|nr:hypothetical protein [Pseudomonadota bacterium]